MCACVLRVHTGSHTHVQVPYDQPAAALALLNSFTHTSGNIEGDAGCAHHTHIGMTDTRDGLTSYRVCVCVWMCGHACVTIRSATTVAIGADGQVSRPSF
jgi:hypothetical protein